MVRIFGYLQLDASFEMRQRYRKYVGDVTTGSSDAGAQTTFANNDTVCCRGQAVLRTDRLAIALSGQPIWRGQPIDFGRADQTLESVAEACESGTEQMLTQLEGPFSLAIFSFSDRTVHLAIDRMGIERIAYSRVNEGIVFANSALVISRFPGLLREIRPQALFEFVFMHMIPSPGTVFAGISKLPPASMLTLENGELSVTRYWTPSYNYARRRDAAALKSELHKALDVAVAHSGVDASTGAFLSGGLDSSCIAGVFSRQSSGAAKTFSIGFGEADYDELFYARAASRHFSCEPYEYSVVPADIVDSFPKIATAYDEPFGNSSAVPTLFCAKLAAEHGISHMLAGDGGDELFAGNERYAKQKLFSLYEKLPNWLRRLILEPALQRVSPESPITPLRKAKSYVDQARVPLPDRFETWNFVFREGTEKLLDSDFSRSIDVLGPIQMMRDVWHSAPSAQSLERMLYYDWYFTLANNDLRKVGTMCELAGVRVSYPMLHPAVVELSTRIPPSMKMQGFELRSFFRNAMSDFLPKETLSKTKQGFGLPFGVWMKKDERLRDLIQSRLSDLKRRRIFSRTFLDSLIDDLHISHESYHGYVIWDLAMLESWLTEHIDKT